MTHAPPPPAPYPPEETSPTGVPRDSALCFAFGGGDMGVWGWRGVEGGVGCWVGGGGRTDGQADGRAGSFLFAGPNPPTRANHRTAAFARKKELIDFA
jgi:hypothetical protein